jgi:hypothetical protein
MGDERYLVGASHGGDLLFNADLAASAATGAGCVIELLRL